MAMYTVAFMCLCVDQRIEKNENEWFHRNDGAEEKKKERKGNEKLILIEK